MRQSIKTTICILVSLFIILSFSTCKKVPFFAGDDAVLVISAAKTTLQINGDRTVITVLGFNNNGEVLHDHTMIVFSATLGTITPTQVEMTDGRVEVEFVTGSQSGVAEIKARSGTITAEPDPLQLVIGSAALENLSISANPSALPAGGGRCRITAHAFDAAGNLLPGIPLVISSTAGRLEKGLSVYYTDAGGMVEDYLQTTETAIIRVESGEKNQEIEITVVEQGENQPPTADFSYSPTAPIRGEKVNFNGSLSSDTDGGIVSWLWDFGDGKSGSGETINHKFNWSGDSSRSFSVLLKVTDNSGAEAVTVKTVTVTPETANQPPVADFTVSPSAPQKGELVYFNASISSDSDGSVVSWHWDFGDGNVAYGETISHVYLWEGNQDKTFTVTLTVADDSGITANTAKTVTVYTQAVEENQPPTADFSFSPASPEKNEVIYFNGGLSEDSDGTIISWQWDFGDGNSGSGENVTHSYTWDGLQDKSFTVLLTVTDNDGASAIIYKTVTVSYPGGSENQLPNADFSYSPTDPREGDSIYFNGSLSSDSDGTIVSWHWDFGDGITGTGENVSHVYQWSGDDNREFTVVLKVTDNDGGEAVLSRAITVMSSANQLPSASFTHSPTTPRKGELVTFNGSSSSDVDGTIVSWVWDFGDGISATGETVTHQYNWTSTGDRSYVVVLTVTDNSGGTDSTSVTITVLE